MQNTRHVLVKLSQDRRRLELEGNAAMADEAADLMHSFYRILSASVELGNGRMHGPDRLAALRQAVRRVEHLCDDLMDPDQDAE